MVVTLRVIIYHLMIVRMKGFLGWMMVLMNKARLMVKEGGQKVWLGNTRILQEN